MPASFLIEDVRVILSARVQASHATTAFWLRVRLNHPGSGQWSIYTSPEELQVHDDTFDHVLFTAEPVKATGEGEKTTYTGSMYAEYLSEFVGDDAQGTWGLDLGSSVGPTWPTATFEITEFGLCFNGECEPPTNCSLSVPWFVDMAGVAQRLPAEDGKVTSIIYLHNNLTEEFAGLIEYFTQDGVSIGPAWPDNYFTLPASATVAFRPVADDPSSVAGGQESEVARAIPNRPMGTEGGNDDKKNGSLVVRWNGEPTDVQGILKDWQQKSETLVYSSSVLLPPGAGGTTK